MYTLALYNMCGVPLMSLNLIRTDLRDGKKEYVYTLMNTHKLGEFLQICRLYYISLYKLVCHITGAFQLLLQLVYTAATIRSLILIFVPINQIIDKLTINWSEVFYYLMLK